MEYYRLLDNLNQPEKRWFLGSINFDNEWDFWKYVKAGNVEIPQKKLLINIREKGEPLDFSMADFELLIVNQRTADLFNPEEVILIPINIKGYDSKSIYFLMCIKYEVDCVDEEKSTFDKWMENDSIRPDKAGQYKMFYKLIINRNLIHNKDIFRIKGYNSIIIISESLMNKIKRENITGIKYQKVTN